MKQGFFLYPFSAIVGQAKMKRALLINAIDPGIGGLLIKGERGTGKSTAARALADLLPEIDTVAGCPFSCDPHNAEEMCESCRDRWEAGEPLPILTRPMRFVTLPLNASEDRVVGITGPGKGGKGGCKGFRGGHTRRCQPLAALRGRGQSPRRPHSRHPAGRRGHGSEHRGTRRGFIFPSVLVHHGRHHEPRGGRAASPTGGPLRAVRGGPG